MATPQQTQTSTPPPAPVYPNVPPEDQPRMVDSGNTEFTDFPYLAGPADLIPPDPLTMDGQEQTRYEVLTGKRVQADEGVVTKARDKQSEREKKEQELKDKIEAQQRESLLRERRAMAERLHPQAPELRAIAASKLDSEPKDQQAREAKAADARAQREEKAREQADREKARTT